MRQELLRAVPVHCLALLIADAVRALLELVLHAIM